MTFRRTVFLALLAGFYLSTTLHAQTIPKDELTFLTSEWKGERFPDGRPKVSDELIERAKNIGIDDAWTVLKNEGYTNQFDGNWKLIHNDVSVTGRAVTAMYMPSRPDVEKLIKERGISKQGRKGNTNTWPIETLTKGDVYVADGFGKIGGGTLMGATWAMRSSAKPAMALCLTEPPATCRNSRISKALTLSYAISTRLSWKRWC